MPKKRLIEKLRQGDVALGLGLMYASPCCIESMGRGWDWVWIDGQHGQHTYATILHAVQVANLAGVAPVVRVPSDEPGYIGRLLDTGTDGLMCPVVDTAEQARGVARAARFPPLGNRSFGGRRVIDVNGRDYYQAANRDILIACQIESAQAVTNAAEIAAVEGIDCLFFGPDDMKMRLGVPINTAINESDELARAMEQTANAARDAGKFAGCVAPTPAAIAMAVALGYRLIIGGGDIVFLRVGAAAKLQELRSALDTSPEAGA